MLISPNCIANMIASVENAFRGLEFCMNGRTSSKSITLLPLEEKPEDLNSATEIPKNKISNPNILTTKSSSSRVLNTAYGDDGGNKTSENINTSILSASTATQVSTPTPATPRGSSNTLNVTTGPKSVAWSSLAKHSSLRNQARQDAQIQKARLQQVLMDSRQKREKSVKREFLTTTGSGRFSRSPVLI